MSSGRRGSPVASATHRRRADDAILPPRPRWAITPPPGPAVTRALKAALRLPAPLCRLLAVRGHETPDAAKAFLRPMLGGLHDPGLLLGARKAARRLARAVADREMVVVHGDYDVDGISGSVLLTSWIRALGGRAEAIVPDRLRDGYDLSDTGVARAARRGAGVLVTVDCGIVAHEPVRKAAEAGMDVIVTDHHRPGDTVPDALAVVNPNQPGCPYPNKGLCGAGVAFKTGQLLAGEFGRPSDESWDYLDLAALATIADMVPLEGENRTITRYGLRALEDTSRPGLRALKQHARLEPGRPVDSASVGFRLAPRINAAGRVGDAGDALRLLLSTNPTEAHHFATSLEENNRYRRQLEDSVVEEALAALPVRDGSVSEAGVVVAGDGWDSVVIGIVASRLAERVFRPVIVVSFDGDAGRGSARSIPTFDLHSAIASCAGHLERFGGHHQAAGLDIRREHLPAFRAAFERVARRELGTDEPVPQLRADMAVALTEIDPGFYHYLRYLGPFGPGNPEPVFVAQNVHVKSVKVLKDKHLKFHMTHNGASLNAIGFGLADRLTPETLGAATGPHRWRGVTLPPVDVAFTLMENNFRGHTTIEAKIRDIKAAE
ncbi:MAG: single-stranded-DNA-specific exonuclease RecJ [Gemmatimonadota bacterium]|nr:single-stranded-DNA-specific exonuclease RecJ [Gemmatimonadota bacterium]